MSLDRFQAWKDMTFESGFRNKVNFNLVD